MILSEWLTKSRLKKALDMLNCGMYAQAEIELWGILQSLGHQEKKKNERAPILFYLAECYLATGDEKMEENNFQGALDDFEKAADLEVNFPDLYFRIGRACRLLDKFERAEDALRKAIGLNPRYVKARISLAGVYGLQDKLGPAIRELQLLHEQGVLCNEQLYLRGADYIEKGDLKRGYEALKESYQEKPDTAQALYMEGMRRYQNKDYGGAIQKLQEVLDDHPDYPDIHNLLGVTFCGQKTYPEAAAAFRKAISLNNDYIEPRLNLAFLYTTLKQKEKAVRSFREVLSMDPGNVIALKGLENVETGAS